MKRLISFSVALALLLAAVPLALGLLGGSSRSPGAAASSSLVCSVKPSCGVGEVAVFRMSALANAHAQTAAGSTYASVVCCSGPAGLSNSCSGSYDSVLWLSAADNAHAASASGPGYATQVCLASSAGIDCQYGSSCAAGYACVATISGPTNAHVADCDGANDYGTKVCCAAAAAVCVFPNDADCDACWDSAEPGLSPPANPADPWDWYDVPVPTLFSGGHISGDPSGLDSRDHAISIIADVLAVLEYSGCEDGGLPNAAGRQYNQDVNSDGVDDGRAYDRSVGATRSGAPDGAITIIVDVLLQLAQAGYACEAPT